MFYCHGAGVRTSIVLALMLLTFSFKVYAAPNLPDYFALGVAAVPEFEGSADHMEVPLILAKSNIGNTRLEFSGNTGRWYVDVDNNLSFGPLVQGRYERDESVTDPIIAHLRPIKTATELGVFAQYRWQHGGRMPGQFGLALTAQRDVSDVHNGQLYALVLSYNVMLSERWRLGVEASQSWANEKFMSTYFSVDADNAERSQLAIYHADDGIKDSFGAVTFSYSVSPSLQVLALLGTQALEKNAYNSPIVRERGERDNWLAGASVMFFF